MSFAEYRQRTSCPFAGHEVEISHAIIIERGCSCAIATTNTDYQCDCMTGCAQFAAENPACPLNELMNLAIER